MAERGDHIVHPASHVDSNLLTTLSALKVDILNRCEVKLPHQLRVRCDRRDQLSDNTDLNILARQRIVEETFGGFNLRGFHRAVELFVSTNQTLLKRVLLGQIVDREQPAKLVLVDFRQVEDFTGDIGFAVEVVRFFTRGELTKTHTDAFFSR